MEQELTDKKRKCVAEMSTETRLLIHQLEQAFIKETKDFVSYADLSKVVGRNVQKEARSSLTTARRYVEREHQVVIQVISKEGLKISDDFAGVLDGSIEHIGRQSRKNSRRIINALSKPDRTINNGDRLQIDARLSQLGAIGLFTKPKSREQITGYIQKHQRGELSVPETLQLFTGK
jgi:hypothetical protein